MVFKKFRDCGEVDQDLMCTVCRCSWDSPVELQPCGHIFCAACAPAVGKTCPNPTCKTVIASSGAPNRILVNAVMELEVQCTVCEWKGTRENSSHHKCVPSIPTAPEPSAADFSPSPNEKAGGKSNTSPAAVGPSKSNGAGASNYNGGSNNISSSSGPGMVAVPSWVRNSSSPSTPSPPTYPVAPANNAGKSPVQTDYFDWLPSPPPQGAVKSGLNGTSQYANIQYAPAQPAVPSPAQQPPPRQTAVPPAPRMSPQGPWQQFGMTQVEYDQVVSIFLHFDVDGECSLTRSQLRQLVICLDLSTSEAEISAMFDEMTSRRNGRLTSDEFCRWIQVHKAELESIFGMSSFEHNNLVMQFRTYDRERRGQLNAEQFCHMCISNNYAKNDAEALEHFLVCDVRHVGAVSLREYLAFFRNLVKKRRSTAFGKQPPQSQSMNSSKSSPLTAQHSTSSTGYSTPNQPSHARPGAGGAFTNNPNNRAPSGGDSSSEDMYNYNGNNNNNNNGNINNNNPTYVKYDIGDRKKKKDSCVTM